MAPYRLPTLRCGVSLVEALVALAVMAFGMLALVGVQATMRLNSDVAKQRGEATRIATEEIERLRGFETIAVVANEAAYASYDGMASGTPAYDPAGDIGNTTYTITRTVNTAAGLPHKSIAVRVSWTDRSNQAQSVTLETAISGTNPALAGLLPFQNMPTASATNQRSGRDAGIPPVAVDLGDGGSAFKPFDRGTVVWVFNNLTGEVVSRCTGVSTAQAALTRDDLTTCQTISALLLAGEVNFNLRLSTQNFDSEFAVVKPVAGSTTALKILRSTSQIVGLCTVPTGAMPDPLPSDYLNVCGMVSLPRTVAPFQSTCGTLPCTDDVNVNLLAVDAEAPQWPRLNLSMVRGSTGNAAVDTAQFNQTTAPECLTDAPTSLIDSLSTATRTVHYYCFVYPSSGGWGGRFDVQPLAFSGLGEVAWVPSNSTAGLKVCRYTPVTTDYTENRNHPATYCMERTGTATLSAPCTGQRVKRSLVGQNFLVIAGHKACPTDSGVDTTSPVNSNTRPHQPAP